MVTEIIRSFDWKNVYFNLQLLIAAAAAIAILYKILMFIFKKAKGEYDKLCRLHKMIETIYSELTPNHGTSLKDKVNAIEKKLEENTRDTVTIMYRQRWLLDNGSVPIYEAGLDGKCTWVNEKYCELTGYSLSEFLNNGWRNSLHVDDRDRIVSEWESAVKDKRDFHAEYRLVSRNGEIYKIHTTAKRNGDIGYIGELYVVDNRLNSDSNSDINNRNIEYCAT